MQENAKQEKCKDSENMKSSGMTQILPKSDDLHMQTTCSIKLNFNTLFEEKKKTNEGNYI